MNIIHLVRAVTWGGGERYALDLCRASVEAGHNVVVATKGTSLIDSKILRSRRSHRTSAIGRHPRLPLPYPACTPHTLSSRR